MALYLEIHLFSYDVERDGVFVPSSGERLEGVAVSFANLANATAVYADAKAVFDRAIARGLPELTERARPGRRPATVSVVVAHAGVTVVADAKLADTGPNPPFAPLIEDDY